MASGLPEAAICVQDIDVQCVLQFTLIHAAGCALHRHTSRVIHRLELYSVFLSVGTHGRSAAFAQRVRTGIVRRATSVKLRDGGELCRHEGDVRQGDRRRFFEPGRLALPVAETTGQVPTTHATTRKKRPTGDRPKTAVRWAGERLGTRTVITSFASPHEIETRSGAPTGDRGFHTPADAADDFRCANTFTCLSRFMESSTLMILPQVHLRKPCYDFYFL